LAKFKYFLYLCKQKWTDDKRFTFIRLMDQHNAEIEIKIKKIDEDITKLRGGCSGFGRLSAADTQKRNGQGAR
jgi:hypothetical protein